MEDATITELEVVSESGKSYCVFGVFDGHGGTNSCEFRIRSIAVRR